MKNPDRETVTRLVDLPNVGKATAEDLRRIGVDHPNRLIGKDAFQMYEALCAVTGKRVDPCVIDVFMAVIDFMEGGAPRPWWAFTERRKALADRKREPE